MIPVLIIWIIRRYRQSGQKKSRNGLLRTIEKNSFRFFLIGIIMLLMAFSLKAQNRQYRIYRNGNIIGTLDFRLKINGDTSHIQAITVINDGFIFSIIKMGSVWRSKHILHFSQYRSF